MGRVASDSASLPGDPRYLAGWKGTFVSGNCHRFIHHCLMGLESVFRPFADYGNHSWLVRWVNCQWYCRGNRVPPSGGSSGIAECCHDFMDRAGPRTGPALPVGRNGSYHDPGVDVRGRHPRAHHRRAVGDPGSAGAQRPISIPRVPRRVDGRWDSSHAGGVRLGERPPSALDLPLRRRPRDRGHLDDSPVGGLRMLSGGPARLARHVPLDPGRDHRGPGGRS